MTFSLKNIKSLLDGKIVVVANDDETAIKTPLFCDICEFPMKTMEDSIAFRKAGCCNACDMRWGTPSKDWDIKEGVYPKKDSEEWLEYIEIKSLSSRSIFILK